jgi:hypothetical protein
LKLGKLNESTLTVKPSKYDKPEIKEAKPAPQPVAKKAAVTAKPKPVPKQEPKEDVVMESSNNFDEQPIGGGKKPLAFDDQPLGGNK